jgi:ribonuclease T1
VKSVVPTSAAKSFKLVLTGFAFLVCLFSGLAQAEGLGTANAMTTVSVSGLPESAVQTYRLIHQGGPFAYEKDGVVFGNRERLLPLQKRGYYREYTVTTPGSRDRGARRIVCGGIASKPDICFYTGDHYASFRMIVP